MFFCKFVRKLVRKFVKDTVEALKKFCYTITNSVGIFTGRSPSLMDSNSRILRDLNSGISNWIQLDLQTRLLCG